MAEEEKINTDIDDWLNDLEDEDSGAEELDQADIDSLLGSDSETSAVEAAGEEELNGELNQSDIDSLLGDGEAEEGEAALPEGGTIDQEEMNRLFGSSGDQEEGVGDEVDFAEILGDQSDSTLAGFGGEEAFDPDAFSLEPEEDEDRTVLQQPQAATVEAGAEAGGETEEVAQAAMAGAAARKKPMSRRSVYQVLFGLLVVLLLGGGAYHFLTGGSEEEVAITTTTEEQQPQPVESQKPVASPQPQEAPQEAPPIPPNHKPVALGNLYQMPPTGGEVAIQLRGDDADGDPLTYELLDPPSHGRLSGKAPSLVYLPNADFPGKDSFAFRVSDGKDTGQKAEMYIVGPDLAASKKPEKTAGKQVVQQKKEPAPAKVLAADAELATTSSEPLVIDWLSVWNRAKNAAVDSSSGVEIKADSLKGTLTRLDAWHYKYQPPKFFQGREIISFRFKRGKTYSVNRLLTVKVRLGDQAPEIELAPLAPEYLAGQTVTIDARGSRDEQRDKLRFVWQQLSGVPVKLKAKNGEGSVVSFIMPSTFAADKSSGISVQVTAVDVGGQRASRDIHLKVLSRRQQALWTDQLACQ